MAGIGKGRWITKIPIVSKGTGVTGALIPKYNIEPRTELGLGLNGAHHTHNTAYHVELKIAVMRSDQYPIAILTHTYPYHPLTIDIRNTIQHPCTWDNIDGRT